jgi:hypothetical protein
MVARAQATAELDVEQRREVAAWIETVCESAPAAVRTFLSLHQPYLAAGEGDPLRRKLEAAWRALRRALHITPSSEKRRASGSPLNGVPSKDRACAKSERERLEAELARCEELSSWHSELKKQHDERMKRLEKRLATMPKEKPEAVRENEGRLSLDSMEFSEEARAAGKRFAEHLLQGGRCADPALRSVTEALMPGGAVTVEEEHARVPASVPEDLANARVVKTIIEPRERYDFAVTVKRIELGVEKKIVVDGDGERHVIAGSTSEYGPPRYQVTWNALATLAELVGQFAIPLNRLGTLLSSAEKRFTAGALGRMLHYVAQRLVPIYLELGAQLSNSDYLAGDDTSCRVLEVASWFEKVRDDPKAAKSQDPPWSSYATPSIAEESLRRCQELREARIRRREDGDRNAVPTSEETPSLGVLIGKRFIFESMRRNGDGPKEAMHTTVVTGRSVAADPRSLIVFYRSHLGSYGNLLESLLKSRSEEHRDLVVQGDLSTTNLVTSEKLLERLNIRVIGCAAHARRPIALYELWLAHSRAVALSQSAARAPRPTCITRPGRPCSNRAPTRVAVAERVLRRLGHANAPPRPAPLRLQSAGSSQLQCRCSRCPVSVVPRAREGLWACGAAQRVEELCLPLVAAPQGPQARRRWLHQRRAGPPPGTRPATCAQRRAGTELGRREGARPCTAY